MFPNDAAAGQTHSRSDGWWCATARDLLPWFDGPMRGVFRSGVQCSFDDVSDLRIETVRGRPVRYSSVNPLMPSSANGGATCRPCAHGHRAVRQHPCWEGPLHKARPSGIDLKASEVLCADEPENQESPYLPHSASNVCSPAQHHATSCRCRRRKQNDAYFSSRRRATTPTKVEPLTWR